MDAIIMQGNLWCVTMAVHSPDSMLVGLVQLGSLVDSCETSLWLFTLALLGFLSAILACRTRFGVFSVEPAELVEARLLA